MGIKFSNVDSISVLFYELFVQAIVVYYFDWVVYWIGLISWANFTCWYTSWCYAVRLLCYCFRVQIKTNALILRIFWRFDWVVCNLSKRSLKQGTPIEFVFHIEMRVNWSWLRLMIRANLRLVRCSFIKRHSYELLVMWLNL